MDQIKLTNLKPLYLPGSILLTIILLFIISFKLFSDRVGAQQAELSQIKGQQIILSQKLSALQSIGGVANNVQNISLALPGDNPSFIEVSQIKRYAQILGLILNSIQIGQETTDAGGTFHASVNFDVEGNPASTLNLIDKLKNAAPITIGNNVNIKQKGGTTLSTFTISVYWSPLPEKLPALTEPVLELSGSDTEMLTKIASLDLPILGTQIQTPTATEQGIPSVPKTNPFGF